MAKRKKRKNRKQRDPMFDDLSPQTKQAISAVLIAVLGVFLAFSLFDFGGLIGRYVKIGLDFLFGGGGYLAPLACLFFVYALLKPKENDEVSLSKIFGIALLFASLLGILELYQDKLGGIVGLGIEYPLTYLVSNALAWVILVSLSLISLFLIFNFGIPNFRREQEETEEDEFEEVEPTIEEIENEEVAEETEEEETEEEPKQKKSIAERLGIQKTSDFTVTHFSGPYDPPPFSLLKQDTSRPKSGDAKANSNIIKRTLIDFGIDVEMEDVETGPTITRYSLKPAQGVKISRIVGLQQELQLALKASSIRIEAPIPGKSLVGIEIPNLTRGTIGLASLLKTPEFTDSPHPLYVALGEDVTGKAHFANIARMPHALIAGTTGSGKSVTIHNIVASLLFRNSPEQLRFIMVDPKRVELTLYQNVPHLLTPVITDVKKALVALKWAIKEMERRYDILQTEKIQNIASYHKNVYQPAKEAWVEAGSDEEHTEGLPETLPYIVIVMDELADLMSSYPKELEASIVRLAQMSRAVGIHLILATQRPSVNVITGTIKANIPTRIALNVASQIDSRTILDHVGAEKLLGQGDMFYLSSDTPKQIRLQSAFISEDEIKKIVSYLKQQSEAHSLDEINLDEIQNSGGDAFFNTIAGNGDDDDDELYEAAKETVIEAGKASTSYIQRKLRVGYSRAARLMDILEERGVIGPQQGSKPRDILPQADSGPDYDDEDEDSDYDNYDEESNKGSDRV